MILLTLREWNGQEHKIEVTEDISISEITQKAWIHLPISCCAWACFVCGAKIVSGQEFLDQGKAWEALIDLEENEFLTCIGWFKTECLTDEEKHEVVMEMLH